MFDFVDIIGECLELCRVRYIASDSPTDSKEDLVVWVGYDIGYGSAPREHVLT